MIRRGWLPGVLILATLVVALWPRASVASVPFAWSPTPSSALREIPTVFLGVDESDRAARSGAPHAYPARALGQGPVVGGGPGRHTPDGAPSPAAAPTQSTPSGASTPATFGNLGPRIGEATPAASKSAITGWATWYATGGPGEYAAAGPALRTAGWRGSSVVVCAFPSGQATCITIPLTDWCACGDRNGAPTLLDLSADAFAQLGALSQGVLKVTVEVLR